MAKRGCSQTEEHKRHLSKSLKRYFCEHPRSTEWRRHISERLFTDTWRKNLSEARKGTKLSLEHRQNIGISLTDRPVSEATKHKIAQSLKGHLTTIETRNKISRTQIEQYKRGERLPNTHIISAGWFTTNIGISVRSSWELFVCNLLTSYNIEWQYEPEVFDLGFATYRPDLYLPSYELWIEVKGYWWNGEKAKVDAFSLTHPLLLIREDKYKQLLKNNKLIMDWLVDMR